MVALIFQLFFSVSLCQAKPPILAFQLETGEYLHQMTVIEIKSDMVQVISNSNFMVQDRDLARIGSWNIQGHRAIKFIQLLGSTGNKKVPITLDRRPHPLRVWINGKKVLLNDLELRVLPTMVEDLLFDKYAELEQGWEFDIKNKKILRSKETDSKAPNCNEKARTCRFGMNARISL